MIIILLCSKINERKRKKFVCDRIGVFDNNDNDDKNIETTIIMLMMVVMVTLPRKNGGEPFVQTPLMGNELLLLFTFRHRLTS